MARTSRTGERGLYRDKSGRYRIDFRWNEPTTGHYRRHRERLPPGTSSVAARSRVKAIRDAALAGGWNPRQQEPQKLHKALERYAAWADASRPKTVKTRARLLKVLKRLMGDESLESLSAFRLERFKRDRLAEVRPATVNRALALFKHFIGAASKWGWVSESKARELRAVKLLKEPPGRVRWFSDAELTSLWKALETTGKGIRSIVEAGMLTGLRRANLVGLRKAEVDLEARQIVLGETKNGRGQVLPVSEALALILEAAIERSSGEFVFVNLRGKPYTPDGFSSLWRKARDAAGIENLRFHDVRHHFATQVRRGGAGLDVVAALLGHRSLAMTQRYAHLGRDDLSQAVASVSLGGKGDAPQGEAKDAKRGQLIPLEAAR